MVCEVGVKVRPLSPRPIKEQDSRSNKGLPARYSRAAELAAMAGSTGVGCLENTHTLYGSGLRLMECLRLRVKDVDSLFPQVCLPAGRPSRQTEDRLPPFSCSAKLQNLDENH